jgi:hypothetical protein
MTTSRSTSSTDDIVSLERKEKLLSRLHGKFLGFEVLFGYIAFLR